jgi:hypothetical protein
MEIAATAPTNKDRSEKSCFIHFINLISQTGGFSFGRWYVFFDAHCIFRSGIGFIHAGPRSAEAEMRFS